MKKKLLDAYDALEAQIRASNKIIGEANDKLNGLAQGLTLSLDRNGSTLVLAKPPSSKRGSGRSLSKGRTSRFERMT